MRFNGGTFLNALGRTFGGYGQDQEDNLQRQRQAQQQAEMSQMRGMEMRNMQSEIDARSAPHVPTPQRHYDASRGGIVDELAGTFAPIPGLPPAVTTPHQPTRMEGTNGYTEIGADNVPKFVPFPKGFQRDTPKVASEPKWHLQQSGTGFVWANPETLEIRPAMMGGKVVLPPGRGGLTEDPRIAATRKDLQGFQGQQIRAEHDVTAGKSDIARLLRDHPRASRPLSDQRTATDSTFANQYTTGQSALQAAEARKQRLTTSADSTQGVIGQLRSQPFAPGSTSAPGATPDTPAAVPMPVLDRAARAKEENDGFNEAVKNIQTTVTDPARRLQAMREAQRIFMARIDKVNAGIDPDSE